MFLLEKWKAAEQSVSSEMDHISIIHNLANTFKYNMNTTNNDYKTKDEQNNQILMRDYCSSKKNLNPIIQMDNNNNNKMNNNPNIRNNLVPNKKFPFGGKTPFSNPNKQYEEDEDNERNDIEMNFKDNAGENFFKKMKSNLDKDHVAWDPPEEKERS